LRRAICSQDEIEVLPRAARQQAEAPFLGAEAMIRFRGRG